MKPQHPRGSWGKNGWEGTPLLVLGKISLGIVGWTNAQRCPRAPNETDVREQDVALSHPAVSAIATPSLRNHRGFTIIEIMIVIVIIGIVLSLAVANLFPDDNERLRQESERTLALLENARDEAALGGRTIGFQLRDNEIEFLERDPQSPTLKWRLLKTQLFVIKPFAAGVTAELRIGADTIDGANANAASVATVAPADAIAAFQPAGVAAPFTLRLATTQNARVIRSDPLGNLAFVSDAAAQK